MKRSKGERRPVSLRIAAFILAGLCLAFFTGMFFIIFYRNMPNMLLTIETKYLQNQIDFLADRFDDIQNNMDTNALDNGTWTESVGFVLGENPMFIENNWSETTPARVFHYNFMIIKDAKGNSLFTEFYDYRNDETLPEPLGFAEWLSVFATEVVQKNQQPRLSGASPEEFGRSGIMFYEDVPYYVSIMPVMNSQTSGDAVGTLIFGLVVDDAYFRSFSSFEQMSFEWEQVNMLQRESSGVARAGETFMIASMPMMDIYGNPIRLFMEGPRNIYTQGRQDIFYASMLMFAMVLMLALMLYLMIYYMFLRPMEKLKEGITGIAFSGHKLDLREVSRTYEFDVIGGAINDMMDRLNQSKTMQSVLDEMDTYLYVTDPTDDQILFVSKKMSEHFGLEANAQGSACWSVLQRSSTGRCEFCPLTQLNEQFTGPVEWEEYYAKNGRYYKNTAKLIKWMDGRTVHIQHCVDITSEKENMELLTEAKEQAEQASLAKSNFLSRMSHEMRTPMNAIIGMSSIAKATEDPQRKEYCLEKIDEASTHLLGVINDILDVSKIEAGKFELAYASFPFERVLQHVTNVVSFRIDEKRQNFLVKIDPDVPGSITCDEQRLSQVLTNLLSNAIKFTPEEGKVSLTVQVANHVGDDYTLRLSVSDTGIGISQQQQMRLFNAFEQADGGISRKFGGTGLGLAISKSIVEMMGGAIWIESELGKGANFIFDIVVKSDGKPVAHAPVNWKTLRALVVDDSAEVLEYFKQLTDALGLRCDTALGGEAACALMDTNRSTPYDIVFVDWRMPEMDGVELARCIKTQYSESTVIIMISSAQWDEIEKEARSAGVSGFLQKPIFSSLIVDCINTWLSGSVASTDVTERAGTSDNGCFNGFSALLAEDIEINSEIVRAFLAHTGLSIDAAENGVEAVRKFQEGQQRYDLILMDIHMPEIDGFEATRQIRAMEFAYSREIPIIAMTANVFREDIEKCLSVGMNDHIGKPVDADELIMKLKKHLFGAKRKIPD